MCFGVQRSVFRTRHPVCADSRHRPYPVAGRIRVGGNARHFHGSFSGAGRQWICQCSYSKERPYGNRLQYCFLFQCRRFVADLPVFVCLCTFDSSFFAEPQLTVIARVIGLTLVINSLGIVQQARLTVDLDFKRLARASLGAVAISGAVGIWLAYHGFGVWTLVWQSLLNSLLRVVFLWIFSRWMPRWIFSWQSFRVLFSFGSKLMLANLLHTFMSTAIP